MMNLIEVLLLLALVAAVILSFLPHRRCGSWAFRLAALAVLISLIDILLGNWRWQIIPAYTLSLLVLAVARQRGRSPGPSNWRRRLEFAGYTLLATVTLLVVVALPRAFPMFELAPPSGPHQVGTMDIHLVDTARLEDMTENPADHRELMVRAWYPADVPDGAQAEPFLREIEPVHSIFSRGMPLPAFTFNHFTKISGHSYLDVPVVSGQGPFPVLIFSHGNSFYASQNTLLMEHLASHGYVIFSIDHPYQASWVRFPDGRIVTYKEDWVDFDVEDPDVVMEKMKKFVRSFLSDSYEQYYQQISKTIGEATGLNEGLNYWLDDTDFLLNQLASRQGDKIASFSGYLDLERIGVFGMSLGGAAAGKFCAVDARCKAGLNMDGTQYGENAIDIRLERPFMMMNADRRLDLIPMLGEEADPEKLLTFEMNDFMLHQARDMAYSLVVEGSTHGSYSDFGVMSNLGRWIGALGSIDGWVMKGILDDYVLAFFNKHLKGTQETLLDGPSPQHPAVLKFTRRDGRARASARRLAGSITSGRA